ncbi:hypothetical protein SteCoe_20142 [Stentor coeruleus]|uniref:Uncharacterized protein n=1 Tax=Stentor coeruleus TaxID=5963 RepID=A0A1R2BSN1_9CILI|nr:hypothetical protein SteCoe_20142 [Stentor coeruleus]
MKVTTWYETKPRGIGRGQFHNQSEGSFRVGNDDTLAYRPTKKVYPIQPPYTYEKPEGTKKLISQTTKNPILNPAAESEVTGKKVMNFAFNNSKEEDMRFMSNNSSKSNSYTKRNASCVFNLEKNIDESHSQKKRGTEKPSTAKNVLKYEYALPYREEKITPKIY